MNLIENGKNFENTLSIEELESIQGGVFCIKYKQCLGNVLTDTCFILWGKSFEEVEGE